MIKAMSPLPNGETLLVLGITKENVRELKQDHPIVFPAEEMRLPLPEGSHVVVSYVHKDGTIALPRDVPDADQIVIILNDETLAGLTSELVDEVMPGTTIRLNIIYRRTQEELDRLFVPFIGPRTVSTRVGFPPGSDINRN